VRDVFCFNFLIIIFVKLLKKTKKGNKISIFEFLVRQLNVPMIMETGLQLLRLSMVIVINMKFVI